MGPDTFSLIDVPVSVFVRVTKADPLPITRRTSPAVSENVVACAWLESTTRTGKLHDASRVKLPVPRASRRVGFVAKAGVAVTAIIAITASPTNMKRRDSLLLGACPSTISGHSLPISNAPTICTEARTHDAIYDL